jgi:hypothetical protein
MEGKQQKNSGQRVSKLIPEPEPPEYDILYYIQSVPGGEVNILGGHSIGNSKQESVYVHMSYEYFETVDKKDILRTVSNTGHYASDKVGTVYLV